MTSNDDILRALGRVEGRLAGIEDNVALLRNEVSDEKANAHDFSAVIHKRLDEQARQIARLDTRVAISGGADALIRENSEPSRRPSRRTRRRSRRRLKSGNA